MVEELGKKEYKKQYKGQTYIFLEEKIDSITKRTAKAYYIIGYAWVPKSWLRIESGYAGMGKFAYKIFVKEYFYYKMKLKEVDWEISHTLRTLKEIDNTIKRYKDEIEDKNKELEEILKGNIPSYVSNIKEEIKDLKSHIEKYKRHIEQEKEYMIQYKRYLKRLRKIRKELLEKDEKLMEKFKKRKR